VSDNRGYTPHDLPQGRVRVYKDGKTWRMQHSDCPFYKADARVLVMERGIPCDSEEDARARALAHVKAHKELF
jgi:hypothetical protein